MAPTTSRESRSMRFPRVSDDTAMRLRTAGAAFVANRVPLWALMWWSQLLLPFSQRAQEATDNRFLEGWFRWDAFFYLHIARDGYTNVPDAWLHRDTHFWPLFPLLIRGLSYVMPWHSLPLAAFLLNNALLFGSILLMNDLAERNIGKNAATVATSLLLTYPFALYYSAGYTESCYLFFALLTFFFGQRRRWRAAGIAAAFASGTRLQAVAVPIALAVLYMEECGWSLRRIRPDAQYLLLGAFGPIAYLAYLKLRFNDPFAFLAWNVGKDWGADITWGRFFDTVGDFVTPRRWPLAWNVAVDGLHVLFLATAATVALAGMKRVRPHLMVFTLVNLFLICRIWTGAGRYCAALFPVHMITATFLVDRPTARTLVTTAGLLFMALFAFMYGHAYWIS
jgi:hypothetical protein